MGINKNITFKTINKNFFTSKNRIKLDNNNKYDNLNLKFSHEIVNLKDKKNKMLLSKKIKKFLTTLDKECKNFDSTIFLSNLEKTYFDIENIDNKLKIGSLGIVLFKSNYIDFKIKTLGVFNHEALHLSSLLEEAPDELMAFYEGYTQALVERYFKEYIGRAYPFSVLVMEMVEQILGKDYLEYYFFRGKFDEALKGLYHLESIENINKLKECLKKIIEMEKKGEKYVNFDILNESLAIIFNILFSCFKNKVEAQTDKDEKLKLLDEVVLYYSIDYHNNYYDKTITLNLVDQDDFNKFYEQIVSINKPKNKKKIYRKSNS